MHFRAYENGTRKFEFQAIDENECVLHTHICQLRLMWGTWPRSLAARIECSYNHYIMGKQTDKPVSAADANREFSRLLQEVKKGHSYVVTSHGKPVARIGPVAERGRLAEKARGVLLRRLQNQPSVRIGRWTRDELYER